MMAKSKNDSKFGYLSSAFSQSFGEKCKKDPDCYDLKTGSGKGVIIGDNVDKLVKKKKSKLFRNYKRAFDETKGKLGPDDIQDASDDAEKKEDNMAPVCSLCKRNRPVFTGDDQLRRLPESTLSPFLKQLKIDSKEKQRYLQQLRITPKFIKACKCKKSQSNVHIYCKTAHII